MLDVFITAFLLHGEELHDVNRELHPSGIAPSGFSGKPSAVLRHGSFTSFEFGGVKAASFAKKRSQRSDLQIP